MVQSMLEDRFRLKARLETRELPIYELVVGKDGSKLQRSADQTPAGATAVHPAPSLFTALQEQLGMKLESAKAPVEVTVIDSIEHPTED